MTPKEEEHLRTICGNSMPFLLTPDELLRFAEAEEIEQRILAEQKALIEKLRARKPADYQEPELSPEAEEELIEAFSDPDLREVCLLMTVEDMDLYGSLLEQMGRAQQTLADLSRLAAKRARDKQWPS
jgi:hypothetical protein